MRGELEASVRRILASWPADGHFHLDQRAFDDWMIVLASARWLYVDRKVRNLDKKASRGNAEAIAVQWTQWVRSQLVSVAMPELYDAADRAMISEPGT